MTDAMKNLEEILLKWLAVDSISGNEMLFLEDLEAFFTEKGYRIERQHVTGHRYNLVATLNDSPRLFYSTHVDTVPPVLPVEKRGTRIYGRGACDTKGGLLAMIAAAEELRAAGHQDLGFLLVVGEEVDHCGAKMAAHLDLRPERIILCEPTENQVVSAQKGMLKFALEARGKAGHSAYLDRGISAIDPLLDALENIRKADLPEDELLGKTTVNIGRIQGGVAANVFAPHARAELLIRAVSPVDDLLAQIKALLPAEVSLLDAVFNDPVFFDPPEGIKTCTVPFNTDATYLLELGPVWLVGPGDIRVAHGEDEHIEIDEMKAGIELYRRLGEQVLS